LWGRFLIQFPPAPRENVAVKPRRVAILGISVECPRIFVWLWRWDVQFVVPSGLGMARGKDLFRLARQQTTQYPTKWRSPLGSIMGAKKLFVTDTPHVWQTCSFPLPLWQL